MKLIEQVSAGLESNLTYEIDSPSDLKRWYPRITGFRSNYVISAKTKETNSGVISNDNDRMVLRAIRSSADLIITTGKTAVSEQLSASKSAPLLILTNSEVIDIPATRTSSAQTVFITGPQVQYANKSVVALGKTQEPLTSWLADVTKEYESVVIESGLSVTLILQELLCEVCLTVTDADNTDAAWNVAEEYMQQFNGTWKLNQLLEIDKTLFFKFQTVLGN